MLSGFHRLHAPGGSGQKNHHCVDFESYLDNWLNWRNVIKWKNSRLEEERKEKERLLEMSPNLADREKEKKVAKNENNIGLFK